MSTKNRKVGISYIPVLHKGYQQFFSALKERGVGELYLIGDDILAAHEELDYLNRKDRLRAVTTADMKNAIMATAEFAVHELTLAAVKELADDKVEIVTPREDVGKVVVQTYFSAQPVEYIDIFLRWHRDNTGEDAAVASHNTISLSDFQREVFARAFEEAEKSSDWWRQVGAALVKGDEVLFVTHNEHMPDEQLPNVFGDTRALFKKGIHIEYVTAAHAEVVAIAEAAKRGIATEGAELYITDFPCPYCARLIAKSGIKKVYFIKGYAVLDGDDFLKGEGVELVRVEV